MNYEVNPFQDYESITIDELADQANSLLNLVTEEQRLLHVCMNNGKGFCCSLRTCSPRSAIPIFSPDPAVGNAVCDGQDSR